MKSSSSLWLTLQRYNRKIDSPNFQPGILRENAWFFLTITILTIVHVYQKNKFVSLTEVNYSTVPQFTVIFSTPSPTCNRRLLYIYIYIYSIFIHYLCKKQIPLQIKTVNCGNCGILGYLFIEIFTLYTLLIWSAGVLSSARVQLSAAHTREQLDRCIAAFIKIGRELGVLK